MIVLKWLSVETLELIGQIWCSSVFSPGSPLLHLLHAADSPATFSKHSSIGHLYSDDVQALIL